MKHQKVIFLAIALSGFTCAASFAQEAAKAPAASDAETVTKAEPAARTLTIDEAVTLAMENNIALSSSAIDVRIAERGKDYALNVFIPTVQATGTLARSNNVSNPYAPLLKQLNPMYEDDFSEADHWNVMAGLTISLNLNAALVEGLRATRQSYEAGLLTHEQARQQTEQNVRKAFYAILLQEGSLALAKDKLAISEDRFRQTQINFKNGLVPELSVLQTQLAVETQKPAIKETELTLDQQKGMFAFLLGLPVGTRITLSGSIEPEIAPYDADELVGKHLGNRLDLAILSKNVEMMNTQIKARQLQRFTPSMVISQSFSPVLSSVEDSWTDTGNWNDGSGAFSVTLAMELTGLLPFSSTGQSIADAKDRLAQLELTYNQAFYSAELEIRNLISKLDKNRTSIAAMELNVTMAEKAYRLTEQGYRAGTIEYLDLKDAENTLIQAQLGVLVEKFNYLSTILDLEVALNTKLTEKSEEKR